MTVTERIKAYARRLGFDLVGVVPASSVPHGGFYAEWVERGYAGEMGYLARGVEKRRDPRNVLASARSIIAVGISYYADVPEPPGDGQLRGRVARYAWGYDYHDVIREKLYRLLTYINEDRPVAGRVYVDTGPILERDVAALAGVGWFGKNTNLLHTTVGSWYFLGMLLIDLDLDYDTPVADHCGTCTRCLTGCPTEAFVGPYVLDARRCISYLTIELKGPIPRDLRPLMGNWIFGCDVCQEVCPWNIKHAQPTTEPAFRPRPETVYPLLLPLLQLNEEDFRMRFRNSTILRAKRCGLLRNVAIALGNLKAGEATPILLRVLHHDPDPLVRGHAAWALGQIGGRQARTGLERALINESDTWVLEEVRMAVEATEDRGVMCETP
jgi:epoxyqueuosine reductase